MADEDIQCVGRDVELADVQEALFKLVDLAGPCTEVVNDSRIERHH